MSLTITGTVSAPPALAVPVLACSELEYALALLRLVVLDSAIFGIQAQKTLGLLPPHN